MANDNLTRRGFIKGAAAAAVVATKTRQVLGANDRVNIAIVGIRGRGGAHINGFAPMENVRITTLCDIDENVFPTRVKAIQDKYGYAPVTVWDMRRVFDDKEIDAVSFATPNHWHALGTIWACLAGKNVYVEKPSTWGIWEGRQMINAARAANVLVQVGFQSRSRPSTIAAMKFLQSGKLGKIYMARGLCFKPRGDIGRYPDGPMAEGEKFTLTREGGAMPSYTPAYLAKVHYDEWIGPARNRPFNRNRFHYNWHWQFEYGNGDTGNQGPHQFDIARWGLGKDEYPVRIRSFGGCFAHNSAQNTPNTQTSIYEYADGTILEFATRGLYTNAEGAAKIGNLFYGSEGWMEIDGGDWKTFMGRKGEPGPDSKNFKEEVPNPLDTVGDGEPGHFGNFIQAVRSGKRSDLNCEIEVGHRSSVLPILGNISYRVGREVTFDGRREMFVGDKEANALIKREEERAPYIVPDLS
ncbi:MAG: gfo/Idh/MocA family oxidoreductase [Acidobacteria bacterium]|nr:MAG: gfo/Idh/MocA family oxidoreductase [Acidobacteriota bacterium]